MEKTNRKTAIFLIILGAILLLYLGFSFIFMSRFIFRTTVNGVPAGFASADSMKRRISKASNNYSISLVDDGSVIDIVTGPQIGLDFNDEDGELEEMLKNQNGFAWPVKLFSPDNFVGEKLVTYDSSMLDNAILSLNCVNDKGATKTEDARYEFVDDEFQVICEVYGKEVEVGDFKKKLSGFIMNLADSVDLRKAELYKQPTIKKDNKSLKETVDKLNDAINFSIEYEEGSVIDKNMLASWVFISDSGKVAFDEEKVTEFVDSLSKKYDTIGDTRKFKTSYGDTVELNRGNYGWKVDVEGEKKQLMSDLENKKGVVRPVVYEYTANSHGEADYGNSYVEVNLSKQQLFLYKDGSLVLETPFVSGNLSKGNGTHVGAFRITYCQRDAVLRGEDYRTPVKYWMPFNGGEGLHDANWRKAFGGNIFRTNGSHGCVNLPTSAARTIFETVEKGYPVLVYSYGDTMNTDGGSASVISKINAIGNVTAESGPAIAAARNAFNLLSIEAQYKVTNLAVLEAAEYTYALINAMYTPEL